MIRFFLKVFFLSFAAMVFSWFFEGAFYTFHYSRAQDGLPLNGLNVPEPAIVSRIVKDTNILLLGMAGEPYPAPYLTDTIMVASIRPKDSRVILTSIPRDLMVKVPGGNNEIKINSLYELGRHFSPLKPEAFIKDKVEEITGLSMDYYALIDVKGLEAFIDALGGVDIDVKKAIADPFFPGPNYSYEPFYLKAGSYHLNGHDAVRFARSRYAPRGDFERIERQHQLLEAVKKHVARNGASLGIFTTLFNNMNNHLVTNVSPKDVSLLFSLFISREGERVQTYALDDSPGGLLKSSRSAKGAYILLPKKGLEKYLEIQKFMQGIENKFNPIPTTK